MWMLYAQRNPGLKIPNCKVNWMVQSGGVVQSDGEH